MSSKLNISHEKMPHIVWAIIFILIAIIATQWHSELIKDPPTTLGTVGFFATAYGILFAIIELGRTKNAAILVKKEVQRALNMVKGIDSAQEIVECLNTTSLALASLEEGKAIPNALLCQIIKHYSQLFHIELEDDSSEHRRVRSTIQAYSFIPPKSSEKESSQGPRSNSKKTRAALLEITGHLAQRQGSNKTFTEHTE
ncbi:hypothetical protein [Janthinobacterium sp. UMAB-56]|uniref:hypothetical protein n=1 Tax=Janthinobacterium sp. UMAB-56 TaxID=1365361 RepID=UPI001C580D5A|nr:hypothetical protein [Janthinobacterium sp. UMAB-56]